MGTDLRALQLARVAVLLLLLWATGRPAQATAQSIATGSMEDHWGPWAASVLLGFVFVVAALLGRLHSHPWPVLAIEALVAGVVAVVPPISWVLWLGVGGSWVDAMTGGFAQPLGITWLAIVCFPAFRQVREALTSGERPLDTVTARRDSDAT